MKINGIYQRLKRKIKIKKSIKWNKYIYEIGNSYKNLRAFHGKIVYSYNFKQFMYVRNTFVV